MTWGYEHQPQPRQLSHTWTSFLVWFWSAPTDHPHPGSLCPNSPPVHIVYDPGQHLFHSIFYISTHFPSYFFCIQSHFPHLLKFRDSAVSALNQVGGLLTDVARHLAPVALNEGLGLIPLHRLQDSSQHEHAALQTVICTLNKNTYPVRKRITCWGISDGFLCYLRNFLWSQSSWSISVQVVPVRCSIALPLLWIIWTPDHTLIIFEGKKTFH